MAALNKNWITEKLIDFEYKRYVLLAYLQEVGESFGKNRLYPHLSDLIEHYRHVKSLQEKKQNLLNAFPQRINGIDLDNVKIEYERIIEDDTLMLEIENIVSYSIPQFEHYLTEGKKIYDFIEEQLHIFSVGVMPLYPEQGYMFLRGGKMDTTKVYEYQITIFEQPDVKYRAIHTQFIKSFKNSLSNTYESVKTDLIRAYNKLPNPATFVIETDMILPVEETFLPIAKRALVKRVGATS